MAEVIDMRRLAPALGASLTHLDLSGHRLDIGRFDMGKEPSPAILMGLLSVHVCGC
jgi:hypothetical protein